jgi:hypothetical protein
VPTVKAVDRVRPANELRFANTGRRAGRQTQIRRTPPNCLSHDTYPLLYVQLARALEAAAEIRLRPPPHTMAGYVQPPPPHMSKLTQSASQPASQNKKLDTIILWSAFQNEIHMSLRSGSPTGTLAATCRAEWQSIFNTLASSRSHKV